MTDRLYVIIRVVLFFTFVNTLTVFGAPVSARTIALAQKVEDLWKEKRLILKRLPEFYYEVPRERLMKKTLLFIPRYIKAEYFSNSKSLQAFNPYEPEGEKRKHFKSEEEAAKYAELMKKIDPLTLLIWETERGLTASKKEDLVTAENARQKKLKALAEKQAKIEFENKQREQRLLQKQAQAYGLRDYSFGILSMYDSIACGENSLNSASKVLLHSTPGDSILVVSGVLDDYVIYSCFRYYDWGPFVQIAVKRDLNRFYPDGMRFPHDLLFKISGKLNAETVLGAQKEMLLLEELK